MFHSVFPPHLLISHLPSTSLADSTTGQGSVVLPHARGSSWGFIFQTLAEQGFNPFPDRVTTAWKTVQWQVWSQQGWELGVQEEACAVCTEMWDSGYHDRFGPLLPWLNVSPLALYIYLYMHVYTCTHTHFTLSYYYFLRCL